MPSPAGVDTSPICQTARQPPSRHQVSPPSPKPPAAMKFGKQLEISANPEWRDNYVQYKRLKRLIKRVAFEVEKQQNKQKKLQQKLEHGDVQLQVVVDETHPLLKAVVDEVQDAKDQFWDVLDANLKIVNDFYVGKVVTLTRSVGEFEAMLEAEKTPTGHVHTRSRTHSQGTELARVFFEGG
ncbi:unnamed protein product [Phytophthora fragariaefolia]|uniref:Unnamed protein product n=1 Tax=Phytophthora fragariaefolia TaxID=1490495 RepID=A0A9W7CP32_9STRA|nr:unnamed protein product [Phytophthora fragariaefolia]